MSLQSSTSSGGMTLFSINLKDCTSRYYPSRVETVPSFDSDRCNVPIQSKVLQPVDNSSGFHKDLHASFCLGIFHRDLACEIPRWLADHCRFPPPYPTLQVAFQF